MIQSLTRELEGNKEAEERYLIETMMKIVENEERSLPVSEKYNDFPLGTEEESSRRRREVGDNFDIDREMEKLINNKSADLEPIPRFNNQVTCPNSQSYDSAGNTVIIMIIVGFIITWSILGKLLHLMYIGMIISFQAKINIT